MQMKMKRIFKTIVFCTIFSFIFLQMQAILSSKDLSPWSADFRLAEYEKLPPDSASVLFVGSSHIMSGIDTMQIWGKAGIPTFNLTTRNQTFAIAYLSLQNALKTQKPKYVFLDAHSVALTKDYCGFSPDEPHGRYSLDPLPTSPSKLSFIFNQVTPISEQLSYYMPFFRYHTRWKELSAYDFGDIREHPEFQNVYMGYCPINAAQTISPLPSYNHQAERIPMDKIDLQYLQSCIELCESQNIKLIVTLIPFNMETVSNGKMVELEQFLAAEGIPFVNLLEPDILDELSLNWDTDFMDAGHLNQYGAQKVTEYIIRYLKEQVELPDVQDSERYDEWNRALAHYQAP